MESAISGGGKGERKQSLLPELEVVAREAGAEPSSMTAPGEPEVWKRIRLAPGVDLHLRDGLPKLKPGEVKKVLSLLG